MDTMATTSQILVQFKQAFILGHFPFEVVYGQEPLQPGIVKLEACAVLGVAEWLQKREHMRDIIHQNLVRAQLRMKHQADRNRTKRQFAVGDFVYLKLQPYVQKSVATRANQKLSFRYYGPYLVLKRVGETTYKLDLSEESKIHPVVHVSQLKKALKAHTPVQKKLPVDLEEPCYSLRVLEQRSYTKGMKQTNPLLIHWSGMTANLATWEDENEVKAKYPGAPAWGQAAGKEGGDVMDLTTNTTTPEEMQEAPDGGPSRDSSKAGEVGQYASQAQPRRSKRGLVPSTRYASQDWTR